jgi:hypothetical protein
MPVASIHPIDEAAALEWLRSQPGRRTSLPAAELGRRWGWQRQRASRRLKAWQKAGLVTRRGNVITVANCAAKATLASEAITFSWIKPHAPSNLMRRNHRFAEERQAHHRKRGQIDEPAPWT